LRVVKVHIVRSAEKVFWRFRQETLVVIGIVRRRLVVRRVEEGGL
jgi:hypothetical protein